MSILTATLRRTHMSEADDGSLGNGGGELDIETRIAQALSSDNDGVEPKDGEGVVLDDEGLPEDSDPELDDGQQLGNDDEVTLASALGLNDDQLTYDESGNVVFSAIIDGKATPVTINDLVKSYQLEGHVNNKSMKLESDRKDFEAVRDQAYTKLAERLESTNKMVEMAEQSLLQEFQSIDWSALRATDPAEWSALRQSYMERAGQIQQAKEAVNQGKDEMTAEQQQNAAIKQQQFVQQEINKMIVDNPTWVDQAVMSKEVGEIGQFLSSQYGFTPEEVANNLDARLMRLIQDARAFRSGKQAVQEKKIPDNIPKFRKPGSSGNRDTTKARMVKAQKDAIRKTGGNVDSIAAALVDRM